jgi:ABC-type transport system substrate-binding protein
VLDALRRGEIDVAPSPTLEPDLTRVLDDFADDTERSGLRTYYTQAEGIETLRYGPRFADALLRRALELSIDRTRIAESVFAGRARIPASYLVAPYREAADIGAAARVDRPRARALLRAAGFQAGTFGIVERAGDRLIATLLVADGSPPRVEAARLVAGDLAAIGIAIDVRVQPAAAIESAVARGAFDLALLPEAASDALAATDRYSGRAGPWFDALSLAARGAPESDQRELYAELQRLWADARPALPLFQRLLVDVGPRSLTGMQPSPSGAALTWNVRDWAFSR